LSKDRPEPAKLNFHSFSLKASLTKTKYILKVQFAYQVFKSETIMKLKYNPIRYVLEKGDETTKLDLLEFLGLLDSSEAKESILTLLKTQMANGGFPSRLDPKTAGVKETCRTSILLLRCGIPVDRLTIQAAVNFLLKHQRENGGWSENSELSIPKEIVELTNEKSVTWITADVIVLLRKVGLGSDKACLRALNWLRESQMEDGGWFMFEGSGFEGSDPDSTARIMFLMKEVYGENDAVYLKGKRLTERFLDKVAEDAERGYYVASNSEKRTNDIYHLTHLFLTPLVDTEKRIESSCDLNNKRIREIMRAIINTQCKDGGWRPFWSNESDPLYTVLALKLLKWSTTLKTEELKAYYQRIH